MVFTLKMDLPDQAPLTFSRSSAVETCCNKLTMAWMKANSLLRSVYSTAFSSPGGILHKLSFSHFLWSFSTVPFHPVCLTPDMKQFKLNRLMHRAPTQSSIWENSVVLMSNNLSLSSFLLASLVWSPVTFTRYDPNLIFAWHFGTRPSLQKLQTSSSLTWFAPDQPASNSSGQINNSRFLLDLAWTDDGWITRSF